MYGAIIGDLVGFPYEYKHEDLTDRSIPLFAKRNANAAFADSPADGGAQEGEDFSDKTVLTAALEEGLIRFEKRLPEIMASDASKVQNVRIPRNALEDNYRTELASSLRRFGRVYPLAGYPMDLSIWLFREGAETAKVEDAGPAARVSPVAWCFQDDLYMMRHMARLQAGLTHRSKESVLAAEAAACAVFLAIHGSTKAYIAAYLEREFGYRAPDETAVREEILRAGGARMFSGMADMSRDAAGTSGSAGAAGNAGTSLPALCVRAALSAFLNGRDFEDVLRRAVSLGGNSADIAAIAGGIAEAFFGIPDEIREEGMRRLPADLRTAADAFAARIAQKKEARENNPAARAQWESALTRASANHPAQVQGNEPLEQAIDQMREKRDQQSFVRTLEILRLRMNRKGRVFVPITSAKRAEKPKESGMEDLADTSEYTAPEKTADTEPEKSADFGSENAVIYSMQTIRTKDGRIWQPAYTSREQLEKANAAIAKEQAAEGNTGARSSSRMVLSYAMDALFKRFLPAGDAAGKEGAKGDSQDSRSGRGVSAPAQVVPPHIQGIVLNPYDKAFFLPRKTIEALFIINREAARAAASASGSAPKE